MNAPRSDAVMAQLDLGIFFGGRGGFRGWLDLLLLLLHGVCQKIETEFFVGKNSGVNGLK